MAVDRPLDEGQLRELHALSTRAQITSTSFVNEHHWGDFRGDPRTLMERYFDAFLYLANWGTRRLMIRLPATLLDVDTARLYCVGDMATAWAAGDHVIIDVVSEWEGGDWVAGERWLTSIIPVRADLAQWVKELPEQERTTLILRMVQGDAVSVRAELLRRFRGPVTVNAGHRTAGELLDAAGIRRAEREQLAAERQAKERARREREAAVAREQRLESLARQEAQAWQRVSALIDTRAR